VKKGGPKRESRGRTRVTGKEHKVNMKRSGSGKKRREAAPLFQEFNRLVFIFSYVFILFFGMKMKIHQY